MPNTVTTGGSSSSWKQSRWVWWVERDGVGIAKYNPVATSSASSFKSPDKARTIYLYYYKKANHFTEPSSSSAWESEINELPSQFHEHMVEKAIQYGYEMKPEGIGQAQYFGAKFDQGVKRGRKFAYRGRTGTIKMTSPTDY
jgi:hypothetical protein